MVMKIPLQQVIEAIEMADDAFTALWDSKTGETVYLDDGLISGMRNEELENLLENGRIAPPPFSNKVGYP